MDSVTDAFVRRVLEILPEEGLKKLNVMIDDGSITEGAVNGLLSEYGIDSKEIIKEVKGV